MKTLTPLWDKLRDPACSECTLSQDAQTVCLIGAGKVEPQIMLVGEAPGYREDETAKPFSGRAGQLLDKILAEFKLEREEIYITNAVHCRPPDNRTPKWQEVQTCRHYLVDEVKGVKPKLIIALGNIACQGLLGVRKFAIGDNRGNILHMPEEDLKSIPIIPTYHPAAILRKDYFLNLVLTDFERAMEVLKNGGSGNSASSTGNSQARYYRGLPREVKDHIVIDLETSGFDMFDPVGNIFCVGSSSEDYRGYCTEDLESVRGILADKTVQKVGHNIKFDLKWLLVHGFKIKGPIYDTLVAFHLLDENYPSKGLKELALLNTDMGDYSAKLRRAMALVGHNMGQVHPSIRNRYCAQDADATHRLKTISEPRLKADGLWPLFQMQMQAVKVITEAELFGFNIDQEIRLKIRDKFIVKIDRLSHELEEASNIEDFNPRSTNQLAELLFDKMGFPIIKQTKTGKISTDESVLVELKKMDKSGIIDKILELRKLSGDYSKYLDPSKELMKSDGRVHCNYNVTGTVTGRWSCKDPNLQQVPRESPIKSMFISSFPGGSITHFDFSQGELRLLAEYSRDERLLGIFDEGKYDIHLAVAAQLLNKRPEDVTKEERKRAKVVNFGILYGEGPKKLAVQMGASFPVALKFMKAYWKLYPGVKSWVAEQHRKVIEDGEVISLLGRRRRLTVIDPDTPQGWEALRQGVNSPVQGTLGDLTNMCMVELRKGIRRENMRSRIIAQVHDDVLVDTYPGEEEALEIMGQEVFRHPNTAPFGIQLRVPMDVGVGRGKNWKEAAANG